jgi:hypothetical protein
MQASKSRNGMLAMAALAMAASAGMDGNFIGSTK